ncbi:MAG: glycerophosphodiester phosphodiesterase [Burkholderiales bacterium]|nr:glycerophosphodiester phosphodiesterase [Burkholderiales bacterium]
MTHARAWLVAAALALLGTGPATALDLQGHRGARGLAPENTLAGFARALGIGVTTLELDLAVTRDDLLVISHDPALNPDLTRGPDGRFLDARGPLIRTLGFDELQGYDVGRLKPGSDYAKRYPQQEPVDGARIPKLDALFALVQRAGNDEVRFAIEVKVFPLAPEDTIPAEDFARRTIAAIRAAGVGKRSTILSFDWRVLALVQREAPEIGTVHLSAQQRWLDNIGAGQATASPWTAGIRHADHGSVPRMVKAAGGSTWSAFFGDLDPAKVREAQALGLQVLAWTVNQPADIERVLDWGVDGIVSDRPDLVRSAMQRRGLPLPRPTPVAP